MTSTRHQIAALEGWAQETNRSARTQPARDGLQRKFEEAVDPGGVMDPDTKAKAVAAYRSAYYKRLALKSAEARAAKAS